MQYAYCIIALTHDGRQSCLSGIYLDRQQAIDAVLSEQSREIWENFYSIIVIEKYVLSSLGHPSLVRREDREELVWFEWKYNEESQTGYYVVSSCPLWGERTFGFL